MDKELVYLQRQTICTFECTLFMMLIVTHVIGKWCKLDVYISGSVTCVKYQHVMICQHKQLFEMHNY